MAGLQTRDIATFQTIHVNSEGNTAVAYPVDEQGRKENIEFTHETTMLLIHGIRKRYHELISKNRARPQAYREIYEDFTAMGYNFSVERIRRKWNNLLGTYKRLKKEYSPRKPPWEYFQILSEFIQEDHSSLNNTGIFTKTIDANNFNQSINQSISEVFMENEEEKKLSENPGVTGHLPNKCIAKQIEQSSGRQAILKQYLNLLTDTQDFQFHYRKRKERRERLKLRALRKIAKELEVIAKTQCEILKRQDLILTAINSTNE